MATKAHRDDFVGRRTPASCDDNGSLSARPTVRTVAATAQTNTTAAATMLPVPIDTGTPSISQMTEPDGGP